MKPMKILLSIAILSLISVYMCEKNDSISTETILGEWEVVSIIADAAQIIQESDSDIIVIEFQSDGSTSPSYDNRSPYLPSCRPRV
jgi:hypothetical protein